MADMKWPPLAYVMHFNVYLKTETKHQSFEGSSIYSPKKN